MREFKFRGKRLKIGKWVYGDLFCGSSIVPFGKGQASLVDIEPETVGQYTGLKDCHGKEIYEGDIIRYPDTILIQPIKTAVVIYKYDRFIAEGFDNTYDINWKKIEVIGNIYDNPKLLGDD